MLGKLNQFNIGSFLTQKNFIQSLALTTVCTLGGRAGSKTNDVRAFHG